MQFLKTLFWVMLAVVAVVFAMRNWSSVTISLWGGLLVEARLPVLLLAAFLLGFLPTFAVHKTTRWRLRKRIDSHERALADAAAIHTPPSPPPSSIVEPPAQS